VNSSDQARQPGFTGLADTLRNAIASGEHPPGSLLPSEGEMSETYGYSKFAVRQAIAALHAEGLVKPERGRRTVVCQPIAPATKQTRTLADPTADLTMIGDPIPLMQHADPDTADLLQVNRNHPIYVLSQDARTREGRPVHTRRLLPMRAIADTELEPDPFSPTRAHLLTTLARLHGAPTTTERIRFPNPEDPDEAAALGIPPHGNIAETIRITHADGRPILAEIQRTNAQGTEYEYRLS
jgi:GntR family transcriptional regulator